MSTPRSRPAPPDAGSQAARGARFRALHIGPTFAIPNPWDAGSAKVLEALGFEALATSSSALAFSLGRGDGEAGLDDVVAHVAALTAATDLPVSVDLENGYGAAPESAARAIEAVAAAGAVGGSIEDFDPDGGIYEVGEATDRVAAAVAAAAALPFEFTLTARAENHVRGNPDIDDTIARLQAYERAGADVVYAPGLADAAAVATVAAATERPLNVLAIPAVSMAELAAAGARRVSVGGSLAWAAVETAAAVATAIRDDGDFSGLRGGAQVAGWLDA
jgi:2-methylisocitrate lyase-like PEP mutase family enzyme